MTAIIQSPLLFGSTAIELSGGTWTKRVLPIGTVDYKGRKLVFDKDYLSDLANAYNRGAYDQVPFQIADAANSHTNDPERTRGWVTGMTVRDDGLWVTVDTTEAGNALLEANPRLGISARIVEEYARSDGNYFPAAIQHVLGTLDPRIPELGPWQSVEMSNGYGGDADMIIDLSASDWDGEPEWDPYDFAADSTHPVARSMRALSKTLAAQYPDLGAADHVADAADAMDNGLHEGAIRHLRAAIGNMTPTSLRRHGILTDAEHNGAKRSMDDIHRHLLLVQEDRDAQATDQQPDVKARTDVTQPVPTGSQRMGTYANDYGYGALEFAGQMAEMQAAIELAYAQAARREAEDAARPMRRGSRGGTNNAVDSDRLAYALDRIGRGTYMPTQAQRNLGFAGDGIGTAPGYGCSCGAIREDGSTAAMHHMAGCEQAMSGDEQAELYRTSGVYGAISAEPFEDANGRTWDNQHGQPMTLTDHLEALTGQRVTREPFNGLRRPELSVPQRVVRFGDRDDPDDPGADMSAASQQYLRGLAAAMGLPDHRAKREEERDRAVLAQMQRPPQRFRTYGEAMDYGVPVGQRESAETLLQFSNGPDSDYGGGKVLMGWNDGCKLPGELVGLTYG